MTISSNSSGLRPGVCTSTTRPTTPYEGQMIYETDTDMVAIWSGVSWRYIAATTPTNGAILQVQTASTTTGVTNNTSTYVDTGLSATITPKSLSSKILVYVTQMMGKNNNNAENRIAFRVVRDSTVIQTGGDLINYAGAISYSIGTYATMVLDSPSSVSTITYKTQFMNPNNTAGVVAQYGTGSTSTIVLMEIAA